MKIAIDISQIIYETGVSQYTKNLVENLLKIDKKNEYLLFGGSLRRKGDLKKATSKFKGNFSTKFFSIPPFVGDFVWNRLHIMEIEKLIGDVNVIHTSDWTEPPSRAFKVSTIHDLWHLKNPRLASSKIVAVHKRKLNWIKKEVDRVIVPSEATKKEVLEIGVDQEKVKVIPEAPDKIFKKTSAREIEDVKKKYRIPGDYLLAVGVAERKNTKRIIEAFEKVKKEGLKLLIIGERKISLDPVRGVIFTGHVESFDRPAIFSGAAALVYPSLHEGFGLPILEAMATATPVVTSSVSSMPEVSGGAAILVDPKQSSTIAQGIKKAVARQATLTKKGLKQVKRYSWEKTARETLKVYSEIK